MKFKSYSLIKYNGLIDEIRDFPRQGLWSLHPFHFLKSQNAAPLISRNGKKAGQTPCSIILKPKGETTVMASLTLVCSSD